MSGMEAFAAVATIFTFIETGLKLSEKAIAVYKGSDELPGLQLMIVDFQKSNQIFISDLKLRSTGSDSGEALLAHTADECQKAATELLKLVDGLTLKDGEKRKRMALKLAFKREFRKSDLLAKQKLFEGLQKQCQDQLAMLMSQNRYVLGDQLNRIQRDQADSDSIQARRMTVLKNEIIAAMKTTNATGTDIFLEKLRTAHKLGTVDVPREAILSSLRYPEMDNRQDRIESPSHSTFDWIFDTAPKPKSSADPASLPAIQYIPWLETGNGIFWITGKAGSGKSTLMKHICNDARTSDALNRWANGRELFVASHYFWYLGSPLEKSYSGLLRSILYKALGKCPDLVESVCEDRWRDGARGRDTRTLDWTLTELLKCLDKLVGSDLKIESRDICFCLFIDGLDEYDGGHEVVDALARLASSGHTKICASSRPWNMFEVGFAASKDEGDYLELHRHTKGDIAKVVDGELKRTLTMTRRVQSDWNPLISEVIDRSEGVFLWVTLVIKKDLRPMLEAKESLASLLEQLNTIPSDKKDRRDTARIFKTCIASDEPLPIATIGILTDPAPYLLALSSAVGDSYMCDDNEDEVLEFGPQANRNLTWDDDEDDVDTARRRVNHRCQDLLEVHAPLDPNSRSSADDYGRIVFMHKSVRDFFDESKTITADLEHYAGPDFDAHLTLSACYVFLVQRAAAMYNSYSMATRWSTQCLLHMRRVPLHRSMVELPFALDLAMKSISLDSHSHWTNYVDTAEERKDSIDLGTRDLLGHLIEFGLLSCVDAIISKDVSALQTKDGRPHLDYALRYDPSATYRAEAPGRTLLSPDPDMVNLLLEHGCDVNEVVSMFNSRTLFDLHLRFLYDINASDVTSRKIVWLLINHGARSVKDRRIPKHTASSGTTARFHVQKHRQTLGHDIISMEDMLAKCFGREEATMMCKQIAMNDAVGSWSGWVSSLIWGQ